MLMEPRVRNFARYVVYVVVLIVTFGVGFSIDRLIDHFPFRDWDLTQPQATLLAGVISGALLIAAAYIAFHGQREQRAEENTRHRELLTAQRQQFDDQLDAQRDASVSEHKASSDLEFRNEVRDVYVRMLANRSRYADALYDYHQGALAKDDRELSAALTVILKLTQERVLLVGEMRLVSTDAVRAASAELTEYELAVEDAVAAVPSILEAGGTPPVHNHLKLDVSRTNLVDRMREHLDSLRPSGRQ